MGFGVDSTNCDHCGAEVPYRANSCSNCGAPGPDDPSLTLTGAGLFVIIMGLAGVVASFVLPVSIPVLLLGFGMFLGGLFGVGREEYRVENDPNRSGSES